MSAGMSAATIAAIKAAQKAEEEKRKKEAEVLARQNEVRRAADEQLVEEEMEAQIMLEEETKMIEEARVDAAIGAGEGCTEDEKKRLLQEHADAVVKLQQGLVDERDRQQDRLAKRLAERRERKQRELEAKLELQRKREEMEAKEEAEQRRIEQEKKKEQNKLEEAMKNTTDPARRKHIIELIMQNRHGQELHQLSLRQLQETDILTGERLNSLREEQEEALNELMKVQAAALNDEIMDADEDGVSEEERQKLIRDLEAEHTEATVSVKERHKHEQATLQRVTLKEIERSQRTESQKLRQRHYMELVEAAKEWAPEQVAALEKQYREAQSAMMKDVENAKQQLEAQSAEELERLKKERVAFAEDQQRIMQKELDDLRDRIEKEAAENRKTAEQRQEETKQLMRDQLKQRLADEVGSLDSMTEEEKSALLKQHKLSMDRQEAAQEGERARQDRLLEEKIRAKRQRQLERAQKRVDRAGRETERIAAADAEALVEEEAKELTERLQGSMSFDVALKVTSFVSRLRRRLDDDSSDSSTVSPSLSRSSSLSSISSSSSAISSGSEM